MTAATILCEQCKKTIVAEAAEYSPSGTLLCANCAGEDRIAEGVARHAASQRKIRTGFIVTFAVAVALSIVMFALGLGRYVQYTFLALAGASFLVVMLAARALGRQSGAHAEGARFLLTRGLLACAVSLVLLAAASGVMRLLGPPGEPELGWVPFTSPDGDCSIRFPSHSGPSGWFRPPLTEQPTAASGSAGKAKTVVAEYAGGQYRLSYWPRPDPKSDSLASVFETEREEAAKRGILRPHTDIWLDKIPGREISFRATGALGRIRIYVTDDRVYELVTLIPDSASRDETSDFFVSFALQPAARAR